MSGPEFSSRPGIPRFRAWRALAAALSAPLLALVFAGSALAVAPVDMGAAHAYSVLATTLTSNGPTAMSDNLGVAPGTTFAGDTAPIVLGEKHLGDTQAQAAMTSFNNAYGDAVLRSSTAAVPADLAGASVDPGVYNTSAAVGFTAGGVLTLDAHGDPNAVFIFQIGAALTIGAGAQVNLAGGADACNVFWAVGAATSIGANAKFAGTVMAPSAAISLGAGTRLDGRVLGGGAVTLSGNAIRTACSDTVVVTGPAGPAGPAGPTGADGARGIQGVAGANGADGAAGADGLGGAQGLTGSNGAAGAAGADGLAGAQGLTGSNGAVGANGLAGAQGLTGSNGAAGAAGPTGATGLAGTQGVTGSSGAAGANGLAGAQGLTGSNGAAGAAGAAGANGLAGAQGLTGSSGAAGAVGATGLTGPIGLPGLVGLTGADGPTGPAGVFPVATTTKLCVTNNASRRKVRRGRVVRWTIVVKNCGAHAALRVSVTDRLRKGARFKRRGGGRLIRGQLSWKTGTLATGASKTYRIATRFNRKTRPGRYINRAIADGTNTRPATGRGSTVVKSGS